MSVKPSFNLLPDMKIYSTNNSCATGTLDLIPTVYKPTHTTHCAAALRFDLASYWCWVSWFPLPWELVFKTTAQISVSSSTFSLLSLSFPPPWAFLDVWFHSRPLEVAGFVSLLPIFTCIMVFQWVVFFGGGGGCFLFLFRFEVIFCYSEPRGSQNCYRANFKGRHWEN